MTTMKLSERFNNSNSVACVVSLRELAESKEIDIPDVQRGLVWNPTQIANLWKSIFAGYPIGALTLYEQGENWQLIDGQQRWHAIKLGLMAPDAGAMTTLWVNADNLELMVCTRRHPWGFRWNEDKLERLPHGEMMKLWKKMMPQGNHSFVLPSMAEAFAYWEKEGWVPLYRLLAQKRPDSVPGPLWEKTEGWRECVSADSLPLIRFSLAAQDADTGKNRIHEQNANSLTLETKDADTDKSRIHELFTCINKGGTEISAEDYTYSTLCSYMGSEFKGEINETAKDFLPPSRVARLYARLAHAIQRGTLREPDSAAYWRDHQYNEKVTKAVRDARDLLKEAGIPASVYLSAKGDEWLTVMCWCLKQFGPMRESSLAHKKLLCMLPYVVCYESRYHEKFCNRFYEALKGLTSCDNLLTMLAIGVAYAACYSVETGMYPLGRVENPELKREYSYDEEWLHIFGPHGNEALLHFLQAPYMNLMLREECGFYPHEPATWGEAMNRPWDVDHIVPQSRWWLLEPDEWWYRESLANKQMLYYRRNREKHDSFAGVPADDNVCPICHFCYTSAQLLGKEDGQYYGWKDVRVYPEIRPAKLHDSRRNDAKQNNYPKFLGGYKEVINRRLAEMVNRLWRELGIAKLVDTINAIPDMEEIPACMELPVACWRYLNEAMPDAENLKWCAIRHDESRQQEIAVKDFYHSLCSWLAVGKVENGAFRCFCWQQVDARTLKIEAGWRRLPDMTQTEWLEGATKDTPRSAWWVEDCSFKDRIYVHEPGSYVHESESGLEDVVNSVKPHSGE